MPSMHHKVLTMYHSINTQYANYFHPSTHPSVQLQSSALPVVSLEKDWDVACSRSNLAYRWKHPDLALSRPSLACSLPPSTPRKTPCPHRK